MKQKQKKGGSKVFFAVVILIALAAIAVYFIFFFHPQNASSDNSDKKPAATQAATEFVITPCDKEDEAIFTEALPGVWTSYTKDGVPYTYNFKEDGSVRYKKDGENAVDYTYTFKDGLLTIKGSEKNFVYQCSKDAVGMMTKLRNGQWQNLFAETAEEIPDFNGCVYIVDDVMYMGSVCLCRDDSLSGFETTSLEGDWLGAAGDTISFASDGTYTYVCNAEEVNGSYAVDEDKNTLTIKLSKETVYEKDHWGLDGRVFHIENQYYFKLTK